MDLKEGGFVVVDWIHPFQNRDQWRALVNTILNLRTSSIKDEFLNYLTDSLLLKKEVASWSSAR
jgi:hypothetical protein